MDLGQLFRGRADDDAGRPGVVRCRSSSRRRVPCIYTDAHLTEMTRTREQMLEATLDFWKNMYVSGSWTLEQLEVHLERMLPTLMNVSLSASQKTRVRVAPEPQSSSRADLAGACPESTS